MGYQDRDWYRDEMKKRASRERVASSTQDRDALPRLIPRLICQLLAVYGGLQLVKNYLLPLL